MLAFAYYLVGHMSPESDLSRRLLCSRPIFLSSSERLPRLLSRTGIRTGGRLSFSASHGPYLVASRPREAIPLVARPASSSLAVGLGAIRLCLHPSDCLECQQLTPKVGITHGQRGIACIAGG